MTGRDHRKRVEGGRPRANDLERRRPRNAASPEAPLKGAAREQSPSASAGNFQDLESLLDQLGAPPVFELGKPLPKEKYLPRQGLSSCPAAHNRALLDEEMD